MRLISPNATATPMEIRRTSLESLARILKCMKLSGYGSAIVQPLARILSLGPEPLKRTVLDTICAAAVSLGEEFSFFVPSIRKLLIAQSIHHDTFEAIASCLALSEPPCTVDSIDYNGSTAFDFIMKTKMNGHTQDKLDIMPTPELKYSVNEQNLKKAWESSMLVQAMGVSGVEGNYRSTCGKVMLVLRSNKFGKKQYQTTLFITYK